MKVVRLLRQFFKAKFSFGAGESAATPQHILEQEQSLPDASSSDAQWALFPKHVRWFDSEVLAFHGTSLSSAQNIYKSGVSNILDNQGIRKEVQKAVDLLRSISGRKEVRELILECAREKRVSIPLGFDDAIEGICESDENRMLSYGSLYVSYRLDLAMNYAMGGPEIARVLNKFLELMSVYVDTDKKFPKASSFISEHRTPVVLVLSLRNAEVYTEGGQRVDNIVDKYAEMRATEIYYGTARIPDLRGDKALGYFDLSKLDCNEEFLLASCNDNIASQRHLYGSMVDRWRGFPISS